MKVITLKSHGNILISALLSILFFTTIVLPHADAQIPKTRILGIVMGISKYQNMTSLKYADRDAMSFYSYLLSPAGGSADTNDIRLLLNEKATSFNFFFAMERLCDMAQEGDQVYIYFAGHGDIEKKTEKQNGFLIGYNAPPNCYAAGGCIGVGYLHDYVEALVSKNGVKVTMIIDACRSGKLAGGAEGAEITALALKADWKGVTKILSCQPGETSLEGERWGGGAGVFSYFLLRGMLGQADKDEDGIVSLLELNNYLDENVLRETNKTQLPEIIGDKRQEIARIDKKFSADFLSRLESSSSIKPGLQAAGFEADISSINDITLLKEYEKFKNHINNDNLIPHNDAEKDIETAYSIYQSLANRRSAQPILIKMKGELLAALQNRAQVSINKFMNSEKIIINIYESADSLDRLMTYLELKTALEIADSSYSQYNQLKIRYLYYCHMLETDNDKKLKILDECMKISPDEPIINQALGQFYFDNKKYDEALKYFKRAAELAPTWSFALIGISSVFDAWEKYDEAIKYIDKAIELKPDKHFSWYSKGAILSNYGKYDESMKYFDKSIELDPENFFTLHYKGITLFRAGKIEEAIKCFDRVNELKPAYYEAWGFKGDAFNNLGNYEEAIKCFDKVLYIKADDIKSLYVKGSLLNEIGNNDEALKCINRAIEINPEYNKAWMIKGRILFTIGKHDEAIKCFEKATVLNPKDDDAWGNMGVALAKLGKNAEAINCYNKAIELKPANYSIWYNKAYTLLNLGKIAEAMVCFDKVIELNPKDDNAWVNKGDALSNLGKNDEAIKCFEKAIELNPRDNNLWGKKGVALGSIGKTEEAMKCFEKAIEINPKDNNAWVNRGVALASLGKYDEVIKCYDKAIELKPDDFITLYNRACSHSLMKNKGEMLKSLKKAIELNAELKENAKQDNDLKEYWNDTDFKELVK